MSVNLKKLNYQAGFTIVELMVGLVIGLIATLIIMQTFSSFEGNKRSTTGIADAQTNGSIGLYMIQRELQFAGYGVPVSSGTLPTISAEPTAMTYQDYVGKTDAEIAAIYAAALAKYNTQLAVDSSKVAAGINFSALKCNPAPILNVDADNDPTTADVPVDIITPVIVTDGAAGNDIVTIQYGTTSRGAIPTTVNTIAGTNQVGVANNLGCRGVSATHPNGDVVLVVGDSNKGDTVCVGSKVTSLEVTDGAGKTWLDTVGNSNQILVQSNVGMYDATKPKKLACLGQVRQTIFDINNNELRKNTHSIVTEIVALQAQYGVSATANSEIVTQWVDANGAWASPLAVSARNRIKAVRIALVARNNLLEKEVVSQACTDAAAGPAKVCIWGNQNVNLPDANWANYRYRTYEIVVPLRNVLAASPQL